MRGGHVLVDESDVQENHIALPPSTNSMNLKRRNNGCEIFQVIEVVPDRQDFGFIEKIQLSEQHIRDLCNRLAEGSCVGQEQIAKFNFSSMKRRTLKAIGIYGDKSMMVKALSQMGAIDEHSRALMERGNLQGGLYVVVPSTSLGLADIFVVYWHHGRVLEDAARNSTSTNFIRYLFDLCHVIFVCVDKLSFPNNTSRSGSGIDTPLKSFPRKSRKPLRVKIEQPEGSQNDVVVVRGVHINVPNCCSSSTALFSEGYYRCALFARSVEASKSLKDSSCSMKPEELLSMIEDAAGSLNIDVSQLKDEEFLSILEHCGFSEFHVYKEMKKAFQDQKKTEEQRKVDIQLRIKAAEDSLFQAVKDVFTHFLGLKGADAEDEDHYALFSILQRHMVDACGVASPNKSFIFVGSEIVFQADEGGELRFLVQSSKGRKNGFIMLEECIVLQSKDSSQQAPGGLAYFRGSRPMLEEPVLSREPVSLLSADGNGYVIEGIVKTVTTAGHLIREWVAEEFLPNWITGRYRENIRFLCYLLNDGALFQLLKNNGQHLVNFKGRSASSHREFVCDFCRTEHPNDMDINLAADFVIKCNVDGIVADMQSLKANPALVSEDIYIDWDERLSEYQASDSDMQRLEAGIINWEDFSLRLFDCARTHIKDSISKMVKKRLRSLIKRNAKAQKEDTVKACEQKHKAERKRFLGETRSKIFKSKDPTKDTLYVKRCTLKKSVYGVAKPSFELEISKESLESRKIKWTVREVSPKKKDLDVVCLNPLHKLALSCSESAVQLSCIDSEKEELKKVVYLRSGTLLLFLLRKADCDGKMYLRACPRQGKSYECTGAKVFRRGLDVIAFEESTRLLVLYGSKESKLMVYKFDEGFRHLNRTDIEFSMTIFRGSSTVKWMACLPGRAELLLLDDSNHFRIIELQRKPKMKPRQIVLSSGFLSGCVSEDGFFLFVLDRQSFGFTKKQSEDKHGDEQTLTEKSGTKIRIKVYTLGEDQDCMSYLKEITLDLGVAVACLNEPKMKIVTYGRQHRLVLHFDSNPGILYSFALSITSACQGFQFQDFSATALDCSWETSSLGCSSTPALDYVYYVFEKFGVSPPLASIDNDGLNKDVHVLFKPAACYSHAEAQYIGAQCKPYLEYLINKIQKERGKDFSNYRVQFHAHTFSTNCDWVKQVSILRCSMEQSLGNWIRRLVCLVPVQICRAESNGVQPLINGRAMLRDLSYDDSISLSSLLRFGLYDAIIGQWEGKIKVISSMGKQSSGKSYLLNHLSGSLLDVAGGRCTDGVWIAACFAPDCLYVLLDFEGLGSFERSEQEDMLLSVLNAAISNLTIFNKKDFHLDKETESVFQRFQNGVSLVKADPRLFNGVFYIAVKDVDNTDASEIQQEFNRKIMHICNKSSDNFMTKMYKSEYEIATMAIFNQPEYYSESLLDISDRVRELRHSYENGRAFLRDLKLVISQLAAKDWAPIDEKRIALRMDILKDNLESAVKCGSLKSKELLANLDTHQEISDLPLKVWDTEIADVPDTGLVLAPLDDDNSSSAKHTILCRLREKLQYTFERSISIGADWGAKLEQFLQAVVDRRQKRVLEWIRCNIVEFEGKNEVVTLQLETRLYLAELKQGLSICGCKCAVCFWRCVLEKDHSSDVDHSCMGDHVCKELCSFCLLDSNCGKALKCESYAGHGGKHDCKKGKHTCGGTCRFREQSSNCNGSCALEVGHRQPHRCSSPQHVCNMKCSLSGCGNPCVVNIENGRHDQHKCHEKSCPKECIINGCRRTCGIKNHFHAMQSSEHLCGLEHPCREPCQDDGVCEVYTALTRQTRSFHGVRSSFDYEYVSEQTAVKKTCCIPIPPFKKSHEGLHHHTQDSANIHRCDVKCRACGYFCVLGINHPGLHHTVHGNMRNTTFVSEKKKIDIEERRYVWGESGIAEMCNMYCKAQGRGHVHLIRCPKDSMSSACTSQTYKKGARHQTRRYGPDFDIQKDELTHSTYWKHMGFRDPCSEEDQRQFALCNHTCRSDEHKKAGTGSNGDHSYCKKRLWHSPVFPNSRSVSKKGNGYISRDGHVFECSHSTEIPHHLIFVIDKSGSMGDRDISPTEKKFVARHDCRLGCVFEAVANFIATRQSSAPDADDIVSVVLFSGDAVIAMKFEELNENIVDDLLAYVAGGSTSYCAALEKAEELLIRGSRNHPGYLQMKPVLIFLSDGGNNDRRDPLSHVRRMKMADPRTVVHTILYGVEPNWQILEDMAKYGSGRFQRCLGQLELAKSFENIAVSLRPSVSSLI